MTSHQEHLATKFADDHSLVLGLSVFKDELNNVVLQIIMSKQMSFPCVDTHAKLILHQVDGILVKLIQQRTRLVFWQVLKAPLKNTAPIWMCGQIVDIATEGFHKSKAVR